MKKRANDPKKEAEAHHASESIDARIAELDDWRGKTLAQVRKLIKQADPEVVEEWKWRGVPVWSHAGIICTGETYKSVVKLTFAKGASLEDPSNLFNSSLDGNTRRAIDCHEGDAMDGKALKALVRAAVALNLSKESAKVKKNAPVKKKSLVKPSATQPILLAGGNPQIAKADGDAPVQAYIAAMPGWKGDVGRRLDAIIERTVPDVCKAVKWNTPLYGIDGQGWFVGFHCITKYVKVSFFRGTSLRPQPPVASKQADVRYLHIHEDDEIDEQLVASWIRQASKLPGWLANSR
ncbi:MAG: DUF1801 domain-containing protein [Pirellulaceae bacterium]|jgi:hypothetical protein|nr:DUF1801 domain-containing protein [Pirellulaceae bacterium]